MQYGYAPVCETHDTGELHWERAERLKAIRATLAEYNVEFVTPSAASEASIRKVHDSEFVAEVKAFCADGGGDWGNHTIAVEATWKAALASAGLAKWAANQGLEGSPGSNTPFALGRPPGHHASHDDAMGFCIFNNAAIAAQSVIDDGRVDKVSILDWDVHHGNGTQDIFYDRGDVLYISLHDQGIYPCTGSPDETGTGDGKGATFNIALPPGSDDIDYAAAIDRIVAPAIRAHDTDLLLVSAGFDLHGDDPVSRMNVSTDGIGYLAARSREIADELDAGLGFVLEGGYKLESLTESISMLHTVFQGDEPISPDGDPSAQVEHVLDNLSSHLG